MTVVIITGTPGTGKTTVSRLVAQKIDYNLLAVNDLVYEKHLYTGHDPLKGYKIVDMDALTGEIGTRIEESVNKDFIIEGHLAHYFKENDLVETVIVLRSRPTILSKRLKKREWKDQKIQENLEAEALDICTYESVEIHDGKVNEIDTTDSTVEEVVDMVIEVINGRKLFPPGNLNFLEDLYINDR